MLLWPLAVGPLCTAVVLACAALWMSLVSTQELWTRACQLTKTSGVALYFFLVALWFGFGVFTRWLVEESQQRKINEQN